MIFTPQCLRCTHFLGRVDGVLACTAFPAPDGIPYPIKHNEHDHHNPYPGDHGVRFEPKTDSTKA
jgi:hypothetical protein